MLMLFVLLLTVAVSASVMLFHLVRARNKRHLLAGVNGLACEASDPVGISVLCSSRGDLAQIENLLAVEYARYEVVVVIDALRYADCVREIVARYRMIGVEWHASLELPTTGVRALGRSRKRCYRRLVLVDRASDTPEGDFNAATEVATYDYVLPVRDHQYLRTDAIVRLAVELGEHPVGAVSLVRSLMGEPATLLSREAVVAAGGFESHPLRQIPSCARIALYEPVLFCKKCRTIRIPLLLQLSGAVMLVSGVVAATVVGWWPLTAVLLTLALVWAAAMCGKLTLNDLSEEVPFGEKMQGKLSVKNFTKS
ncbi:MAG: hypothetical protein RR410_04900 [Alistipes sp.]